MQATTHNMLRYAWLELCLVYLPPSTRKLLTDNSWMAAEYWATTEKLEKMQRDIQDVNAKSPYEPEGSSMTLSHALVRREILRKQVQMLTAILASATLNSRYSTKDIKRVPALDVQSLREKLNSAKKESQQMDIQIQKRNWVIDVQCASRNYLAVCRKRNRNRNSPKLYRNTLTSLKFYRSGEEMNRNDRALQ